MGQWGCVCKVCPITCDTNFCILIASAHPAVQNMITRRSCSPLRLDLTMMRQAFGPPLRMTVMQTRTPLRNGRYRCIMPYRVVLNNFLLARSSKDKTASKGFSADEHDTYLEDYTTRYVLFILSIFSFGWCQCLLSVGPPKVDETDIGNRDHLLKATYKGLPKLRYVSVFGSVVCPLVDLPHSFVQGSVYTFMVS